MHEVSPFQRKLTGACVIAGTAVVIFLQPLLFLRMLPLHDFLIHLRWADQFYSALQEGQLLPRWAHASFSGLGDPTFFYYQPLFYYISSTFLALGITPNRAVVLAAAMPYVLTSIIAYQTVLKPHPDKWGLAGALLVVISPSFLFVSTHMGLLPWTLGVPLSIWFILESLRQRPRIAVLAILLCLVCLSHLLSALMALCCAGPSRLILNGLARRSLGTHITWGVGLTIGLGLSAFFVYPAVTQLSLINPDGWTSNRTFDWHASMMFPTFTYARFGARWMAFQWFFPVVVLAMALFVVFSPKTGSGSRNENTAFRYAIASLVAFGLGSELAYPLYTYLSPLQKLQFPYRFLPIAAIMSAIAFVLHLNEGGWHRATRLMRNIAVLLILSYCAQAYFVQWSLYRNGKPLPERSSYMAGHFGQSEYLIAARGPHWKSFIKDGKLAGECSRLGIQCEEAPKQTHSYSAVLETSHPVLLRLPIFAFPAWGLTVDGQPQPLVPDPETGLVLIHLPPGRHIANLAWMGLPAEHTGRRITEAAFGLLLLALFVSPLLERRRTQRVPKLTLKIKKNCI